MGLDMYAYHTKVKPVREVGTTEEMFEGLGGEDGIKFSEFFYWRKHPNLHGWMEELYREKGGGNEFNCRGVVLTERDLDRLEEAIKDGELPHTAGFFFGESDESEEQKQEDLVFVEQARTHIKDGMTVWYESWW
jgi:hypothetical protein